MGEAYVQIALPRPERTYGRPKRQREVIQRINLKGFEPKQLMIIIKASSKL